MLTDTEWIVLAVLATLLVAAVFALVRARAAQQRRLALKRRFGPEYDHAIEEYGSVARAERELAVREKRAHKRRLTPLAESDRRHFLADWQNLQTRFVDDPASAVREANELIKTVMSARGYASEVFEERVADLSVEHAHVVQHYRAAHELAAANREGRANTEELRQAVVHYRGLFAALLEQTELPAQQLQEVRA